MDTPAQQVDQVARTPRGTFAKGCSGNPHGVTKARAQAAKTWKQLMAEIDPEDEQGRSRRDVLLATYLRIAREGEPSILRDAVMRELGKIPDVIQQDMSVTVKVKRGPSWQP